jgi:hypothetical protein
LDIGAWLSAVVGSPAGTAIHSSELGFVSAAEDGAAAGLGATRSCAGIDSSSSFARSIGRLFIPCDAVAEIGSIDRNIAKANGRSELVI